MKIRLGLIQYAVTQNPLANRTRVFSLLDRAAKKKPDYLILPEMWLGGPTEKRQRDRWARFYSDSLKKISGWSARRRIGCFFSQVEKSREAFYNTAWFIGRDGRVHGRYRKVHLFALDGESRLYRGGAFSAGGGKIAAVVCYDIRFPELVRLQARRGATLLIVCAQWPEARIEHWLALLKARAIENQIFVAATNRLGVKGKNRYGGHSAVFDPWGRCLLHLPETREIGMIDIDLKEVGRIRKSYPFFSDYVRRQKT
ncbi:MAG: hypothetical protein HYU99_07815 [Deltaproteobacteria bacterium]|nr:hypothetical protein [Deltaproteobacteria bacterium]